MEPKIPEDYLLLIIALVATGFSIAGAFFQSYLVQEKGGKKEEIKKVPNQSLTAIIVLGLISAMIIISANVILNPQMIQV